MSISVAGGTQTSGPVRLRHGTVAVVPVRAGRKPKHGLLCHWRALFSVLKLGLFFNARSQNTKNLNEIRDKSYSSVID